MENSVYVGLSRQTALRRELSLVANNIANINTTSFKREMGIYSAVPTNTAGTGRLDFVIDHGSSVSFEPGSIKNTGNDLAEDWKDYSKRLDNFEIEHSVTTKTLFLCV